jgi:hypothetical protein
MNLAIGFLDGKGNFKCTGYASNKEGVMKVIEHQHWLSYQGFRDEKKDFLPLEYQIAAADIINLEVEGWPVIGRWGRNTGLIWF